jgi:serine kinase of HPr protein (carbohydrate metabolism regulator)
MTVKEMESILQLKCIQNKFDDKDITEVYTSDLLSDVLANATDNSVLVTIQAHKNTVAVGSLKGSPAIIICNDRPVPDDMIEAAASEHIALFTTTLNQYTISGKLFLALNRK